MIIYIYDLIITYSNVHTNGMNTRFTNIRMCMFKNIFYKWIIKFVCVCLRVGVRLYAFIHRYYLRLISIIKHRKLMIP